MTKREFTAIILKLTGIYILVRYLGSLPSILSPAVSLSSYATEYARHTGETITLDIWVWGLLATLLPTAYFAICILIVVKSKAIAAKLIKDDGEFNVGFSLSQDDVLIIAFCCIGLAVLVGAIPDLIESGTNLTLLNKVPDGFHPSRTWIMAHAKVAADSMQALIGIALFLQARGLAGLWRKLRNYK